MSLQTRRKKNLKKELGLIHSKDERIFYFRIMYEQKKIILNELYDNEAYRTIKELTKYDEKI